MDYNESIQRFLLLLEDKDQEECFRKFGKILFGDARRMFEKDTPNEKKIWELLIRWVRGDFMNRKASIPLRKSFLNLVKCKENYDILQTEDVPFFYRISKTTRDKLQETKPFDSWKESNKKLTYKDFPSYVSNNLDKPFTIPLKQTTISYKPKKEFQSWTTSFEKVIEFLTMVALINMNQSQIFLIYETKLPLKECIFKQEFLNFVAQKQIGVEQDEVIHIGYGPYKTNVYSANMTKRKVMELLESESARYY